MLDTSLPLLKLLPIEEGADLRIYAVNGQLGQIIPSCACDKDSFISVQQGLIRLESVSGSRILQRHESELLPAGTPFRMECLTDTRAKLILPVQAALQFDHADSLN